MKTTTPRGRNEDDRGPAGHAREIEILAKACLTMGATTAAIVVLTVDSASHRLWYWYLASAISLIATRGTNASWMHRAAFHGFAGATVLAAMAWTPEAVGLRIERPGLILLTCGTAIDSIRNMWWRRNDEPA